MAREPAIPKSQWGDGPWQSEPDDADWIDAATGQPCYAERSQTGAWCGYVGVSRDHPAFGLSYHADLNERPEHPDEGITDRFTRRYREQKYDNWVMAQARRAAQQFINLIMVHGGLTFAGDRNADPGLHWFGFDCSHAGDVMPMMEVYMRRHTDRTAMGVYVRRQTDRMAFSGWHGEYRTLEYVREQCASLAQQLADIAAPSGQRDNQK